jgi:hypothetical protein
MFYRKKGMPLPLATVRYYQQITYHCHRPWENMQNQRDPSYYY